MLSKAIYLRIIYTQIKIIRKLRSCLNSGQLRKNIVFALFWAYWIDCQHAHRCRTVLSYQQIITRSGSALIIGALNIVKFRSNYQNLQRFFYDWSTQISTSVEHKKQNAQAESSRSLETQTVIREATQIH